MFKPFINIKLQRAFCGQYLTSSLSPTSEACICWPERVTMQSNQSSSLRICHVQQIWKDTKKGEPTLLLVWWPLLVLWNRRMWENTIRKGEKKLWEGRLSGYVGKYYTEGWRDSILENWNLIFAQTVKNLDYCKGGDILRVFSITECNKSIFLLDYYSTARKTSNHPWDSSSHPISIGNTVFTRGVWLPILELWHFHLNRTLKRNLKFQPETLYIVLFPMNLFIDLKKNIIE